MILQETSISLTPTETKAVLSLLGIAVAMALWALKVVVRAFIEMRDQGRDIKHAVFGDPKASPKNGLIRTLEGELDVQSVGLLMQGKRCVGAQHFDSAHGSLEIGQAARQRARP